jgi:hypothetical protein
MTRPTAARPAWLVAGFGCIWRRHGDLSPGGLKSNSTTQRQSLRADRLIFFTTDELNTENERRRADEEHSQKGETRNDRFATPFIHRWTLARMMTMPYALFDGDTKISKAYPTADEVWAHAREAGLVIDKIPEESGQQHILDQGYQIRACEPDSGEDPKKNERKAEKFAERYPYLKR